MSATVLAGVQILEAIEHAQDGLFVLGCGLCGVVGCKGMENGPGVEPQFPSVEGALPLDGMFEMAPEFLEGVVLADHLFTFLSHY